MDRRRLLALLGIAAAAFTAGAASGQTGKRRIGFLSGADPNAAVQRNSLDPFRQTLRELGHVEGQNLEIHYRWADGRAERLPGLVEELLRLPSDLILAFGPGPALTAKKATTTVPILAIAVDDPVETGLVADFARPGGNITGISGFSGELVAKRLELLKGLVPAIRRAAVLMNPATIVSRPDLERLLATFEKTLGISILLVDARGPEQFDDAFDVMARNRTEGVLVLADSAFWVHRGRLHALVAKHRLPSVWGHRDYLEGGGLASYQSDFPTMFRRAAAMADRILKGAKPADTPFEQATKLDLAINLKAAQAMGITVPPSLLLAADHVIR